MAINSAADLQAHLELAIKVELSTVPPYLYAMYSIEDQQSEAALLIRSVVVEEMLHAALVANLLVAVGGDPDFRSTACMPCYPGDMLHHRPPLRLELLPASRELIRDTFMVIEQPEAPGAPPEDDDYETLGQFYLALEQAIQRLAHEGDLFAEPRVERQMADPNWYGTVAYDAADSGGLMAVTDAGSAIEAIEIIVHQGEGLSDEKWADPAHQEMTHYHKFLQIADGVSELGRVRPAIANPSRARLPEHLWPLTDLFNAAYRLVYLAMAAVFEDRRNKEESVGALYSIMAGVMSPVAQYLMSVDLGDGHVAGPTFEPFAFGDSSPVDAIQRLATDVAAAHPELRPVAESVARLDPGTLAG